MSEPTGLLESPSPTHKVQIQTQTQDRTPDTLIIVCCHAIYLGRASRSVDDDDSNNTKAKSGQELDPESEWLIEPFQSGETATFTKHVEEGIRQVSQATRGKAVLCYSGGATKKERLEGIGMDGGRTEAQGYFDIAKSHNFFGYDYDNTSSSSSSGLQRYIFQERFATDSYQNVLLSLIQYPIWLRRLLLEEHDHSTLPLELTLPKRLIIISHEFKRARFTDLHLPAIASLMPSSLREQYANMEVEYIGMNPPFTATKMAEIEEGDRKRGYGVWKDDLYGNGKILSAKRLQRGWDGDKFLEEVGGWFDEREREEIQRMLNGHKSI